MSDVSLKDLTKYYGEVCACSDVSVEIADGEFFFLLGPSGCGKTTILRMIAGFVEPTSGEIAIGGKVINQVPPHRRGTAMVFQNYALWPHMSVMQNVEYGLKVQKLPAAERESRARAALQMVRMDSFSQRQPAELSGGQQQRVALARALAVRPKVVLLDEPLSNLDAKLRGDMRQELREIQQRTGLTAIYVTHDQKEALSLADRIAVISEGRVQQVGTPFEVYRHPENRFVADFIGESNFLEGRIRDVSNSHYTVETPAGVLTAKRGPADAFQSGERVVCVIRPEAVRLGEPVGERSSSFKAKLSRQTYLGDVGHLEFQLSSGDIFRAVQQNPSPTDPDSGGEVVLSCSPDDVVLLRSGDNY